MSVRAAIYARVSTADQATTMQGAELRRFVETRAWSLVDTFEDVASGATTRRPALDALWARAKARELDVVVVWRFDRFARSLRELVLALDAFHRLHIDFVSATEAFDTSTPLGKAMFGIVGAWAELERDIIRERVNAGLRRAKAKGKTLGRPTRVISDEQRDQAERLRAEGRSWRSVARAVKVPRRTLERTLGTRKARADGERFGGAESPPVEGSLEAPPTPVEDLSLSAGA